jgi:hypothetical protein
LLLEGPDFRGTASVDFGVKKSSFKFGNHNTPIIVASIGGYHFLRKHILQEEAPTSPDATIPDLEQRLFSTNISNGLVGTTNRSSVGPSLVESEFSLAFETLFPSTDAEFAAKLSDGNFAQQVALSKPEYDIVSMDVKDTDSIINLKLYGRAEQNLPITSVQAEEINVEWLKGSFPAAVWEYRYSPRSKPKSFKFYSGAKISFDAIPEDPSGEIQADLQEYADDPLDLPLADKSNKIVKPDDSVDEIEKKTIMDLYYGDFESDDLFQPIGGAGTDLEEGSNTGKELVIDWSNKEVSVLELIIVDLPLQPGHKAAPILEEDGKRDYEEEPFGGGPPS